MNDQKNPSFEDLWTDVKNRSVSMNMKYFYGVKTTGIFCRAGCPARLPKKESIVFFHSSEDAIQAGFRPCKRCKPDEEINENDQFDVFLGLLELQADEIINVEMWANIAGVSPQTLRRTIRSVTGLNPSQIIINRKMVIFKAELKNGGDIVSSQNTAGFGSSSRLYEKADMFLGMTPLKFSKGGKGEMIMYTVENTPVGLMLIAATNRGVCSIKFGDTKESLIEELKNEFDQAEVNEHTGELKIWIDIMQSYFSGEEKSLSIPLNPQATAFQLKVWSELRNIPFGETRNYSQIAHMIGMPKAARAVASACAANPVAVVTPCHRVVHKDGSVSGYRWGVERKKALLELERSKR